MTAEKPLADTQQRILVALLENEDERKGRFSMTANDLGYALGYRPGDAKTGRHDGSGVHARTMGPAVHVIPGIIGLRKRKMIAFGERDDGRSGTADVLTTEGWEKARELKAAGVKAKRERT